MVSTVPNEADFTFGVSVTAPTAKSALSACARRNDSMIAALSKAGVKAVRHPDGRDHALPEHERDGTRIVNFTASNSVTVMTRRDLEVGRDRRRRRGRRREHRRRPEPDDRRQGRALAAGARGRRANARSKAQAIAAAAHVRLGPVTTVSETFKHADHLRADREGGRQRLDARRGRNRSDRGRRHRHLRDLLGTLPARAVSSAGRAPGLHPGGRRFDPVTAHSISRARKSGTSISRARKS